MTRKINAAPGQPCRSKYTILRTATSEEMNAEMDKLEGELAGPLTVITQNSGTETGRCFYQPVWVNTK